MNVPDFAIVIPLANEAGSFNDFIRSVTRTLDLLGKGKVYLVVDKASRDNTLELCREKSTSDKRFVTIFAPENKNVVDAYLRGYKEAFDNGHPYIIEMDAGLSHDPALIPDFLKKLLQGYSCVFGSRFMKGGTMTDSSVKRKFLSRAGTYLSNILLGTSLKDMTSGYQAFDRETVGQILAHGLRSQAHFYQTEVRYLLRKKKNIEIPISYQAPSPGVSANAINNSIKVLLYYFFQRLRFRPKSIL